MWLKAPLKKLLKLRELQKLKTLKPGLQKKTVKKAVTLKIKTCKETSKV